MTTSTFTNKTIQDDAIFYILSNFAIGSTDKGHYWQEQVATLQRDALPLHIYRLEPTPTIVLATDTSSQIAALLNSSHTRIELWSTWCSFLTPDRHISDSFLIINAGYHGRATANAPSTATTEVFTTNGWHRLQLTLHFVHEQHLDLLEAIDEARQLHLCIAGQGAGLTIPLYDPELALHLEYIRPLYR